MTVFNSTKERYMPWNVTQKYWFRILAPDQQDWGLNKLIISTINPCSTGIYFIDAERMKRRVDSEIFWYKDLQIDETPLKILLGIQTNVLQFHLRGYGD